MFNCYCFASLLLCICKNNSGEALRMLLKEGLIHGDPLSMFFYGIGILLLIRKLKELDPKCFQPWVADDDAALERWFWLYLFYKDSLHYDPDFHQEGKSL